MHVLNKMINYEGNTNVQQHQKYIFLYYLSTITVYNEGKDTLMCVLELKCSHKQAFFLCKDTEKHCHLLEIL